MVIDLLLFCEFHFKILMIYISYVRNKCSWGPQYDPKLMFSLSEVNIPLFIVSRLPLYTTLFFYHTMN
jgi:hypothetical protein